MVSARGVVPASCRTPQAFPPVTNVSLTRSIHSWAYDAGALRASVAVLDADCQPPPPAAFYRAAVAALRADEEEPVLVLFATSSKEESSAARALSHLQGVRAVSYAEANLSFSRAVHGALLAADHIVVAGGPALLRKLARERQRCGAPYHATWSWCAPLVCDALDTMVAASVVEVQSPSYDKLVVRSTLASDWRVLPESASAPPAAFELPRGMWAKRDVCVGYSEPIPSRHTVGIRKSEAFHDRRMILVQADRTRHSMLWPLRWPRHYADGLFTPYSISDMRYDFHFSEVVKAMAGGRRTGLTLQDKKIRPLTRVWHNTSAVVVEATLDNLFHMLFHAVPLREDLGGLRAALAAASVWSATEEARTGVSVCLLPTQHAGSYSVH